MKTILFLSHSGSLTGAPLLLYDIASRLSTNDYRAHFVVGDEGPLVERFRQLGPTSVEPIYPDEMKYWRELKRISSRIDLLRTVKPDLLFCNTIHPAKWLVYARLLGIPTLTHVLELSLAFKTLSILEHQMVKRFSQQFIAASDAVKRYLVDHQGIDTDSIRVVHAGVDLDRFGKKEDVDRIKMSLGCDGHLIVGTVGRIAYVKGTDLFLELASRLKQQLSPALTLKFLIVGTTADKEYHTKFQSLLDSHRLRDDVVVIENAPETSGYFSAMDMYVSTAREDPFPLVVLEAMATRIPVVSFAVGGIPEAVTPDCGVLIDGIDLDAMTRALIRLIDRPDLRNAMGLAARKRVEQQFEVGAYARRIEDVIRSVLQKRD